MQQHKGNTQPAIDQEEHYTIGEVNGKGVFVFDNAGNQITSFGGSGGQATVTPLQAWPDPKGYIGLVTVTGSLAPAAGNVTLDAGSKTQIVGNVTLSDPKGFIGLVTVVGSLSPAAGNVTLDAGSLTGIIGNVTLTDSKGFIGLTTVVQASSARSIVGNVTISDSKGFIGLTTVVQASSARTITGNVTLSDSKGFIGLTTVVQASTARTITGNVTISDSKGFIGLVTNVPAYGSNSTVFTGVISATGTATVVVAPASNRFFIKNAHVASLGRSEVEIRSGATTLIPFTSLSTTSGFNAHYGEQGLPARAQADALVVNLNGGATISYMFNVRFEA